ncbi:MAG: SGNH/GDSL hydrolase family protein [Actinomycetota bacterium]
MGAAALLLCGCLGGTPMRVAGGIYAALGDSYTAGPFIPNPTGNVGCWRSDHAYPALVAAALHVTALHNASCGAATIGDLSAVQQVVPVANPPQLDILTANTNLVTLGIGANDMQFIALAATCLDPAATTQPCTSKWVAGSTDKISGYIGQARQRLLGALRKIRARAPHAAVFVVGYPAVVPDRGSTCAGDNLPAANVPYVRAKVKQLDAMLAAAARSSGDRYIDEYTPSIGHDLCQPPGARWIEPIDPTPPVAEFHPNAAGMAGMARVVVRAVQAAS